MHDYRPHHFDTRGLAWSAVILGAIVGAVALGSRYGGAIASEKIFGMPQGMVASAAAAAPTFAPEPKEEPPRLEGATLSRFTVGDSQPPKISARSYIVADIESGEIFAAQDALARHPIASITKLLTASVALDLFAPTTTIKLTAEDRRRSEGAPGSIPHDDSFTLFDALHAMLTESNNSVANALARTIGTKAFIEAMREKAGKIGMTATFDDPSGLSELNTASALDILELSQHIFDYSPSILAMTRAKELRIKALSGRSYTLSNYNVFAGEKGFFGGKTGYTDAARQTMTTVFEVPVKTKRPLKDSLGVETETAIIAIIVLGSEGRKADIEKLRDWFEANASIVAPRLD